MTPDQTPSQPKRKNRKGFNKAMKIVRRVHLYLGLLLVPWVVLFGASGFLFNHNSTFWGGTVETLANLPGARSSAPVDIGQEMQRILARLNAASGETYQLADDPWLSNHLRLAGKADGQPINLTIDLTTGSATATASRKPPVVQDRPSFDQQRIDPSFDLDQLAQSYAAQLEASGIPIEGKLTPPERGSNAELRFIVTDSSGRAWRGSYDLATSTLSGVADDSKSEYNLAAAMTRLHKTHHYPDTIGARWLWIFVGDITALSLVIWGLSGLVMWWQIQPSRAIGTLALFIAALASFYIISGTLSDYTHNPIPARSR